MHFSASGLFDSGVGLRLTSPLRLTGKPPPANDVIQTLLKISRSDSPGPWGADKGNGDEVFHWYRRVSGARIGIWLDSRLAVLAPVILWCVLARRSRSTFLLQLGLERPRSLPTRLTATPVHQPCVALRRVPQGQRQQAP